ncbi:NUDIX hydrolase [Spirulina subsalsa]|uniref:NUDIX hydrolase n=1 Tax=Spirulina subsalsa TaxID=54311 RepID=UPI0002F1148C|nr:NUDIX hydrolase [Spirulina subsalsa]
MTSIRKWQKLNSKWIIQNEWCTIRQDTVQLSSGKILDDYFINLRPDVALVLPVTPQQDVVFVRQYRHGVEKILLELPAGKFDPTEEDSLTAAQRELEEETGYISSQWSKLTTVHDSPVQDTNQVHIFLAENVVLEGTQHLDENEELEVVLMPFPETFKQIKSGEICVSATIVALFLGWPFLEK